MKVRNARPRRTTLTVAALGATVLLLAGCGDGGGNDDDRVGVESGDKNHALALKYAACMREHGVDMADPEPGTDGSAIAGAPDAATEAALKACARFMPVSGAGRQVTDDAKTQDDALKLAQCLRAGGIDVPDPQPGQGLSIPLTGDRAKLDKVMGDCGSGAGAPQGAQPK
ncbi:hypothetical protein [Embleya sp. NPDC001921]